jgi:hypothetical protein
VLDAGNGDPAGDGAYWKNPGVHPHDGTVYVVAGHGGALTGGPLDHPVMATGGLVHGSVLLDFDGTRLTFTNLPVDGSPGDTFRIVKEPATAPVIESVTPPRGSTVPLLDAIEVTFDTAVSGVDPSDLTVNGAPATSVKMLALNRYVFEVAAPPAGTANVAVGTGIVHQRAPLGFGGDAWTYQVPCLAPPDVTGLRFDDDRATLRWDDTAGAASGGRYDLARIAGGTTLCLASALAMTETSDPSVPENGGAGFWYLVRGESACGAGTWGYEGRGGTPGPERVLAVCE